MLERLFEAKSFGLHISKPKKVPGNICLLMFRVDCMVMHTVFMLSMCHDYVSWLCIMAMYLGYVSWLCILAMYHGYVPWPCIMAMYHGYVSQLCIMDMYHGYVSWFCNMAMYHSFVSWLCIICFKLDGKPIWGTIAANPRMSIFEKCFKSCFDTVERKISTSGFDSAKNH